MNQWEHVNCCKNVECSLFGVINTVHYQFIGQNGLCPECGDIFPIISPSALSAFNQQSNKFYPQVLLYCPTCGQGDALIRNGCGLRGAQRWRCRTCNNSFTDESTLMKDISGLQPLTECIAVGGDFTLLGEKSQTLSRHFTRLAFSARVEQVHLPASSLSGEYSTITFTVEFNDSHNKLFVIATADNKTGCVIAISTNYVALKNGISPEWWYPSMPAESGVSPILVRKVFDKDRVISRRPFLFDIAYGPANVRTNDPGTIVKPVLAAYRHFALVHALTDHRLLSVHHWLEHECFIYGACLMANRVDIAQQRCGISFVYEEGSLDATQRLRSETVRSDIVWRDTWNCYSQRNYNLAVCHLTGKTNRSSFRQATLKPARAFQEYLFRHPIWPKLTRLAPRNVVHLLEYLAAEYNRGR
ncbi:IS1 family transposase [Lelliottia amnigena]|uniref:IS1/IS1595 family N-terminal zinc-binding domain-containing protein n=1 Tax=Lelliottia amnigena TaxID=61646 RepID=UPI001F24D912|nr:hypothetical protein [Lelliottia amnigena]UJD94215.1 IS1 family transposase [Lelliottia amnigena]